ncbi:MAG: 3-deoxy-D-manno-octulosonic acid transferase [Alphaproteobacteria bacterium]|nr:3-deoxy-D-manno-octulosonic acid transferase [Alphaproteobacteria bacterium]MCB9984337.1 3-deoxy-D-manno-octulosonic acid transferase [Micavibrio sp.]HRK97897.1 3-deoxy-D-manno-octulosonic acid transferase [Alphaproteobacteria bacterium]
MTISEPLIRGLINRRVRQGKEDPDRIQERFGQASCARPSGTLMWVHVASVGEALSVLTMIDIFLQQNPDAHVLITTITKTAALLLDKRLPDRAFHQYLPVDRPKWVRYFLDHWKPDIVLWAESELWPFMIAELGKRRLPVALLNARLSPQSFKNWTRARTLAEKLLSSFTVIMTQTERDKEYFDALGGRSVVVTDNIKYCAPPLPCSPDDLAQLREAIGQRPAWVYASTHQGEEELALEVHRALVKKLPDLLTIVIPRHPERAAGIESFYKEHGVMTGIKSKNNIPTSAMDMYVVDQMGELGLFYRVAPLACIGRSFSDDGGGGHNPLEAALLGCAVLHGPHIQNLQEIFDQMDRAGAAVPVAHRNDLAHALLEFLKNPERLSQQQRVGYDFAVSKSHILSRVIQELEPIFLLAHLPVLRHTEQEIITP